MTPTRAAAIWSSVGGLGTELAERLLELVAQVDLDGLQEVVRDDVPRLPKLGPSARPSASGIRVPSAAAEDHERAGQPLDLTRRPVAIASFVRERPRDHGEARRLDALD